VSARHVTITRFVIDTRLIPRVLLSCTASYDAASNVFQALDGGGGRRRWRSSPRRSRYKHWIQDPRGWAWQTLPATSTTRILNPRLLSFLASCDVAINSRRPYTGVLTAADRSAPVMGGWTEAGGVTRTSTRPTLHLLLLREPV
jgi:hypothetical protein